MKLKTYDYRDPARLIDDVAAKASLRDGGALLVLVEHPSTTQRIVKIERLPVESRITHYEAVRDLLCARVNAMPIPNVVPPTHSIMAVLVRRGLTVFGPNESNWLLGWRYSNHLCRVHDSDIILVTEHGWADFTTGWGGHNPRMA